MKRISLIVLFAFILLTTVHITPGFDCEGFYYNTAKMLERDGF